MTKANFAPSLKRLLVHEGGKVDDPRDPGGRTNQGVTQRVYDMYRKTKKLAARDVYDMENAERDEIYRQRYWNVIKGDQLPAGIDYMIFDGSVNSGNVQSVKWVQRALGSYYTGRIDGVMGESTLAAIEDHPNHDELIERIAERRMLFLKALKHWPTYRKGWTARVASVEATAQAWATGSGMAPMAFFAAGGDAKAFVEDGKPSPSKAPGDMATSGGIVSGVIAQASDQLTPLSNIEFIANIVAALTVAGVVIALCGIAYRAWAKQREKHLADALDRVRA
jgi:lysozyme family protein